MEFYFSLRIAIDFVSKSNTGVSTYSFPQILGLVHKRFVYVKWLCFEVQESEVK